MAKSTTIQSVKDGTRLTFSDITQESFTAALASSHFSAQVIVSTYFSGDPSQLFQEMAKDWRGWERAKVWSSLENELDLAASSDRLGHVELVVTMLDCTGPADWRLESTLHLEAGQLDEIANRVKSAFAEFEQ